MKPLAYIKEKDGVETVQIGSQIKILFAGEKQNYHIQNVNI